MKTTVVFSISDGSHDTGIFLKVNKSVSISNLTNINLNHKPYYITPFTIKITFRRVSYMKTNKHNDVLKYPSVNILSPIEINNKIIHHVNDPIFVYLCVHILKKIDIFQIHFSDTNFRLFFLSS